MAASGISEIVFNHHDADYAANWKAKAAELHARDYPLAWTSAHGGYWVLASWADTKACLEDWRTFSSDNDIGGARGGGKGVTVPRQPYRLILNESDPPLHTALRMLEAPFLMPKALRKWAAVAEEYLNDGIDAVLPRGEADLVRDVIIPTTARTTLHLVGWDMSDWENAALSAHDASYITPGAPGYPMEQMDRLRRTFREMLADRRASPREDVVTALSGARVLDRQLGDDEAESMISALVFGGFDTITSASLHALVWLDGNRDCHRRLIDDDAFLANAADEFLRIVSPASGVARTATRDVELGGQTIRKGQHVYFWLAGANRDPRKFENPERVWLERPNARDHLAFSAGGHRCLGASLGKIELKIILRTFLSRIPDYRVDHAAIEPFPSFKSTNGLSRAPVSFSPRPA